jgi:hypothetical protein
MFCCCVAWKWLRSRRFPCASHREAILIDAHPVWQSFMYSFSQEKKNQKIDGRKQFLLIKEWFSSFSSGKDNIKISGGDAAVGHTRSHSEHEG